jgi:putative transposase
MSDATFYKYKAKFSGMEVNEARRLRDLEDENRRLKKLVADLSLDKMALEEVLKKI